MLPFHTWPLMANLGLFALLAAGIWLAGTRLAYLLDSISEKTRLTKAFMGLIFLAAATSLPELVTTLSATMQGNAVLALNNLFGGITMQTAILAVVDIAAIRLVLTASPKTTTPMMQGMLLICLLALVLAASITGDYALLPSLGLASLLAAGAYLFVIRLMQRHEATRDWNPADLPEEEDVAAPAKPPPHDYDAYPLRRLVMYSLAASAAILVTGALLTQLADVIAEQTGLGSGFIGVTLLAASTSLPELSTTLAAARIGAYGMAMANIFGSNLIMVFLILPADLAYREGPILNEMNASATFALVSGILVTAIYCAGLLFRPRRQIMRMGADSLAVAGIYAISLYLFYTLR